MYCKEFEKKFPELWSSDVKDFLLSLINRAYEEGRQNKVERIVELANDLRNAKIDHPVKVEWNDALEQSANKLEALIKTIYKKQSNE